MSSSSLIMLQITLTFWERDPQVQLALMSGTEAADESGRIWRVPFSTLGRSSRSEWDAAPSLELPLQVLEGLGAALAEEPKDLPLWLNFTKPQGNLGALPWERVLVEALSRPVLRLPDRLERPRENREVLEVAICFDAPPETPRDKAAEQIARLVDTILRGSPRSQTRIGLFTTANWYSCFSALRIDGRVQHYDPARAPTVEEASRRSMSRELQALESPWSIWISESLATRSLDGIHFISRCDRTDAGPCLVFSTSPSPRETVATLSSAGAPELAALMTRVGAWLALFTPTPDNRGDPSMALMADSLAHSQPGSALYHPLSNLEHETALQRCFAFLFSPQPAAAPLLSNGFLYCQPAFVAALADLPISPVLAATQVNAALIETASPEQPPNWASAAQRHLETIALEELRRRSPDVLLGGPESARTQINPSPQTTDQDTAEKTLADIQQVIGDYLQRFR